MGPMTRAEKISIAALKDNEDRKLTDSTVAYHAFRAGAVWADSNKEENQISPLHRELVDKAQVMLATSVQVLKSAVVVLTDVWGGNTGYMDERAKQQVWRAIEEIEKICGK